MDLCLVRGEKSGRAQANSVHSLRSSGSQLKPGAVQAFVLVRAELKIGSTSAGGLPSAFFGSQMCSLAQ